MELTKEEKEILFHTLGYDYKSESFRNSFVTSVDSTDFNHLVELKKKGLMDFHTRIPSFLNAGDLSWYATDEGKDLAQSLYKESQPKLTRSQKRYRLYLKSEADEGFGNWLKNSYWDDYRKRNGV